MNTYEFCKLLNIFFFLEILIILCCSLVCLIVTLFFFLDILSAQTVPGCNSYL